MRSSELSPTARVRRRRLLALAIPVLVIGGLATLLPGDGESPAAATSRSPSQPSAGPGGEVVEPSEAAAAVGAERRARSEIRGEASSSAPKRPIRKPRPTPAPPVLEGDGTFVVVPGATQPVGSGWEWTYQVEIERGLSFGPKETADQIDSILSDPRSWARGGVATIRRVPSGAQTRIVLASPATTDRLCLPLQTMGELSCRTGNQVVLNAKRWAFGSDNVPAPLDVYRSYLVNHEVGHALGFDHEYCSGPGALAPVMQQQSKGMQGCRPNGWPFPGAGR